ncbi:MAG TPA: HIRAN domain-containing protein [Puia sp.]|nr:HIRAN domain-containing protein [Puia sp.]
MDRSEFLKKLLASAAMGKLPLSLTKKFRKIYLLQCFVAGFRHYEGMQLLDQMKEDDLLELVREPANEHDVFAIALHWQGKKIGFLPAAVNETLSHLLDADALPLFAAITHLEKKSKPWETVAVAVYFIQEENKMLPAHAGYLTRIEAPHYRTLNRKKEEAEISRQPTVEALFDNTNLVLNLDNIPEHQQEAKHHFEKYYPKYSIAINKSGRFIHVKDDSIYSFIYEISEEVNWAKDEKGQTFFEFHLI